MNADAILHNGRPLVAADTLPFDWSRPLRHPKRDQWGVVQGSHMTPDGTLTVTVSWGNGSRNIRKPLGWFLRTEPTPEPPKSAYDQLTGDQRELVLYAENTSELYAGFMWLVRNMQRRIKRGTYDPKLAPRLWRPWVDNAAARYRKEMCEPSSRLFTVADRNAVAAYFAETEYASITNGEYDETDA